MSTKTTCPCCGEPLDALVILEEYENCPNQQCRADADAMFEAAMDTDDVDADVGSDQHTATSREIVYPYEGDAYVQT